MSFSTQDIFNSVQKLTTTKKNLELKFKTSPSLPLSFDLRKFSSKKKNEEQQKTFLQVQFIKKSKFSNKSICTRV